MQMFLQIAFLILQIYAFIRKLQYNNGGNSVAFDEYPVFIDNPQGTLKNLRFIKKSLADNKWGEAPEITYSDWCRHLYTNNLKIGFATTPLSTSVTAK